MSHNCNNCNNVGCNKCYEARLSLGLDIKKENIVGSLDGVYIKPVSLKQAVKANETNTKLKYDADNKRIVLENERSLNSNMPPDYVSVSQILSGSNASDLGDIGTMVDGGLASVVVENNTAQIVFEIPDPIQVNESTLGLVAYVPNPIDGARYKLIQLTPGSTSDSVLVGHPDGTMEFSEPVTSHVIVPANTLTNNGYFSGTPSVSSGTWRYQTMGTSPIITNTYGSNIEVELHYRYSMQSVSGTRNGTYARLVNNGADYKTTFLEGINNIKQEGYPGGQGRFRVRLTPNQRAQFEFGGFANASGNMTFIVGNVDESGYTVVPPIITVRRLV